MFFSGQFNGSSVSLVMKNHLYEKSDVQIPTVMLIKPQKILIRIFNSIFFKKKKKESVADNGFGKIHL